MHALTLSQVCAKFQAALSESESEHELKVLLNFGEYELRRALLARLQQLSGFRLSDAAAEKACTRRRWRLLPVDVTAFVTQLRSSNLMGTRVCDCMCARG